MLAKLSLRTRIFLFFCLLASGGIVIPSGGLLYAYARAGEPELLDPFIFSGVIIVFLTLVLVTGVWLLFDENVAKPIERIAASLRVRAHTDQNVEIDQTIAKHLGDLGPAARAVADQLTQGAQRAASAVMSETARLSAEKARLTTLLSDIPIAVIVVNPAHQIVLYDSQSANVLSQVAHPQLNASLFRYFESTAITDAYTKLTKTGHSVKTTLKMTNGVQQYEAILKPLDDALGYMLVVESGNGQNSDDNTRSLIYDFNLLRHETSVELRDQSLSDLCFVVFDSETTGLTPSQDEVVQISAVRIVGGRIIENEVFDELVDPGKPIPRSVTNVHKITNAMVQGRPRFVDVASSFHEFCSNAVIVAHNAPFDMAFLHRYAPQMGIKWNHPILDTVLLSAILFGSSEEHTLDSLSQRFGVIIPDESRHTALGDAQATAEIFCNMLPILEARGFSTLADVIEECQRHSRLLEDLNEKNEF